MIRTTWYYSAVPVRRQHLCSDAVSCNQGLIDLICNMPLGLLAAVELESMIWRRGQDMVKETSGWQSSRCTYVSSAGFATDREAVSRVVAVTADLE
jgi:hypothetical protein